MRIPFHFHQSHSFLSFPLLSAYYVSTRYHPFLASLLYISKLYGTLTKIYIYTHICARENFEKK